MQTKLFALSFGFAAVILATQHGFAQTANSAPRHKTAQHKIAQTPLPFRLLVGKNTPAGGSVADPNRPHGSNI